MLRGAAEGLSAHRSDEDEEGAKETEAAIGDRRRRRRRRLGLNLKFATEEKYGLLFRLGGGELWRLRPKRREREETRRGVS